MNAVLSAIQTAAKNSIWVAFFYWINIGYNGLMALLVARAAVTGQTPPRPEESAV